MKPDKDIKKKVAFPHMGTVCIAWAAALKKIGVEPFIPPYTCLLYTSDAADD